jgi:hypothetical protein
MHRHRSSKKGFVVGSGSSGAKCANCADDNVTSKDDNVDNNNKWFSACNSYSDSEKIINNKTHDTTGEHW